VCNYSCSFCFHTSKNRIILPIERAKHGLRLLADAGMKKLNISGGEPFLEPEFIGEIFRYSCDSFDANVNYQHGRGNRGESAKHVGRVFKVAEWCRQRGITVKINSVITR
jgi:radical S-adenosyl methionine domain-containing protein 2